jgi:flavin reductase (DIM6/NTAB) family NADH-FMN oxidoreductase RutF
MKIKLAVLAGCCALMVCSVLQAQDSRTVFGEPELLYVGDKPMNADGGMMYPSPAIFDFDNDGQAELVIGTIFGAVYSCENANKGSGDPVWEEPVQVRTADNEPLKLNNW